MKFIKEYKTYAILPKELRNKNLIYHSTSLENFEEILNSDTLYGSEFYDSGIATSRNKHYAYGSTENEPYESGHNLGDIQLILDRDKIKYNHKISAFDWEELKLDKSLTGKYSNSHQSEDKKKTQELNNISKYIIGIHIVKNKILNKIFKIIKKYPNNWIIFDEDWNSITVNETNNYENFNFDKVRRLYKHPQLKVILVHLEKGMPVKWTNEKNEEMTGYFYDYGATTYKVMIKLDKRTLKYGMIYVSYDNKTFELNEEEIMAKKYNLL